MGSTDTFDTKYATLGSLYELKARKRKRSSNLLKNALTFWSYDSLSSFAATPNHLVKKSSGAPASSVQGKKGRRSHSISACVGEVTKCALQILYSGRDSGTDSPAGPTSPASLAASKNGLTIPCCLVSNSHTSSHLKRNGVTCHQKRCLQRLSMRQIREEETDVLEGNGENYDGAQSEELPLAPPPPPPPPMPPDTQGRFNKIAISISKNKAREEFALPAQSEEWEGTVLDEVLLKTAGVWRFQSRFHSWPETAPPRPIQRNYCSRCYAEKPPRRLSAPIPICVTYYTRVRLRSFSHLLAGVPPPRRCHGDACAQVSTYQATLCLPFCGFIAWRMF
jgi:hypothetical protein